MKKLFNLSWLFFLLLIFWSGFQLRSLVTEYSVDQFYPTKHPLLSGHEQIRHQFRLNNNSPFLFVLELKEGQKWTTPENIQKLEMLGNVIHENDKVAQMHSLTQIEGASISNDEMVIGNLFNRVPPEQWDSEVKNNALLYPLLITENYRSTLMAIESKLNNKAELEKFQKEMIVIIKRSFPEVKIYTAGVPLLQTKLSTLIEGELIKFLGGTALAFCLVFYFLFTHWSAIACAFITILSSNTIALALLCVLKIPMNAILVTLPIIISVSMMSVLIHSLHLWATKDNTALNLDEKFKESLLTLKEIWLPNSLGIVTTALGFLAIAPSSIPLISQYGLVVAAILTIMTILGQLILAIQLPFVTPKMRPWFNKPATWASLPVKFPKFFLISSLLVIISTFTLPALNFSQRLFDDLPQGDSVRETSNWIDQNFGGIVQYDIKANAPVTGFWKRPTALKQLASLAKKLRSNPKIGTVVTVSDFFQVNQHLSQDQIAEFFFLFSMAERNPLLSFLSEDAKELRIAIRLSDLSGKELKEVKGWIKDTNKSFFPKVEFLEGGMASYAHAINEEVSRELVLKYWHPLLLIGIFLIFIFRSFKWALLSCLPNFFPPLILMAALKIGQVPVKPGIALIFSIALGFAFNNTLYLLTRLRNISIKNEEEPLQKAIWHEANPCLFETVIMFVGFSIFLNSEFNMNQTFGGFMLISILAGFISDLFFLPALLNFFPQLYTTKLAPIPVQTKGKIISVLIVACWSSAILAAPDAKEILKKSQALLDTSDDQAKVEMKIVEQNGESKSRSLDLKTLRKDGFSVLARIESPADIKNMSFLGQVDEAGNEKQWIFMPSSGKVRRLVTGKTKAGLLGSEISPEDLNSEAIKSSSAKLLKTDDKYFWIEIIPTPGTSDYSRVITKISIADYLPKFTAYYVKEKLKKTVAFKDYKQIGKIFRAHFLNVQNHLNGRSTEVRLTNVKINSGLSADQFSQATLKDW